MTTRELLKEGSSALKGKSPTNLLDAQVLLAYVLEKDKEWLYLNGDYEIDNAKQHKYRKAIKERQSLRPIAYLTNNKEFFGINLFVNENVLIPRPETEELVSIVLEEIENRAQKVRIAEIGTGSGAISISLSLNADKKIKEIVATDISDEALYVARKNSRTHKTRIFFKKRNILSGLSSFDLIVSNPPYIANKDKLPKAVTYEPQRALFVKKGFLETMVLQISQKLTDNGKAFLEIEPSQRNEIIDLAKKYNLQPAFREDLSGKIRFASLVKSA